MCVSLCPWVALVFLSVDARLLFSFTGFMFEFCHGSLMLLGAALQYYFPKDVLPPVSVLGSAVLG